MFHTLRQWSAGLAALPTITPCRMSAKEAKTMGKFSTSSMQAIRRVFSRGAPVVDSDRPVSAGPQSSQSGVWRRVPPGGRMLQNRTIRGKLVFGVVTLAIMIIALTGVGLAGFYRFRSLAESISIRATELPMATDLNLWAATARDSNTSICLLKSREGMIDSTVLSGSDLKLQRELFASSMFELSLTYHRYAVAIGMDCSEIDSISDPLDDSCWLEELVQPGDEQLNTLSSDTVVADTRSSHATGTISGSNSMSGTLIDTQSQRASLARLGQLIRKVDRMRQQPRSVALDRRTGRNELVVLLGNLVDETRAHLDLMHTQMSEFSREVRVQHQAGIAIAWTALIAAIVITIMMVWFFQTMVIEPFSNLVVGARLVARGQFGHRIDMGSQDEIGELATILNQMTENFEGSLGQIQKMYEEKDEEVKIRSQEVIRNEQLAGVGFLAAGFAHEINNPLAAIAWSAESLESRVNDVLMFPPEQRRLDGELTEELQENLQRIQGEAYRCKSITERMLSFSRVGHVERETIEIQPIVRDVVEMVGAIGKYRCKQIQVHCSANVTAHANSQEIRQVILNLITNAMESVDHDGQVEVRIATHGAGSQQSVASISVRDTGCGMTGDVMQHLFEPFYTRRRDGTGTGLGLSISYRIISQHGGRLTAHSDGEGQGSEFRIELPVSPQVSDGRPGMPAIQEWMPPVVRAA